MGLRETIEKVGEGHYVLPKTGAMGTHADLFLSEKLLYGDGRDPGLEEAVFAQVVNAASFPGVTRVAVTPDCPPRLRRAHRHRGGDRGHPPADRGRLRHRLRDGAAEHLLTAGRRARRRSCAAGGSTR